MLREKTTLSGIYVIRNTVSGRVYVGSALDIRQRWHAHRSLLNKGRHHSPALCRSWQKHGSSVFIFDVIEIVSDKEMLIEREQYWIDRLNSACRKSGFNVHPTAGSSMGHKHSSESRAKMSAQRTGRTLSPEGRANIAKALIARNRSAAMRGMVRASKIKLYSSPERREQLRAQIVKMWENKRASGGALGFPHTEESKKKMSAAKKGKMSELHKAAIASSNRKRSRACQVFGAALHG